MRQIIQRKNGILILSLLALIALIMLAGELKGATFRPARLLGRPESAAIQFSVERTIAQIADVPAWKQFIFWLTIFVIVVLVSSLLSPELRKRLILGFLRLSAIVLVFLYLVNRNPGFFAGLFNLAQNNGNPDLTALTENLPPPVFQSPHISSFLSYIITFGIILLMIAGIWLFTRWWARQQEKLNAREPLDEIAAAARASLDDLAAGKNWDDAIIQCYARMSLVVDAKRGLHRLEAMTPSEFALRLERAGLPGEPVQRLTSLFESVRYGARRTSQTEINQAVDCLTSILKYCGEVP